MMAVPKGVYGCCVYDFIPSVHDELYLQVGCLVKITKDIDEFWYSGETLSDGTKGLFPKDFVKIIKFPSLKKEEKVLYAIDTFYPEEKDDLPFKKGDVIVLSYKVDSSWGNGYCNGKSGIFPLNYTKQFESESSKNIRDNLKDVQVLCNVTATMSLIAQIEGELSFEVGDHIAVTKIMPDEWAYGYIDEKSGTFPLSFTSFTKGSNKLMTLTKSQESKSSLNDHSACLRDIKDNDGHPYTSNLSAVKPFNDDFSSFSITKNQQSLTTLHDQSFRQSKGPVEGCVNFESYFSTKSSAGLDSGYNSNDLKEQQKQIIGSVNKKHFVIANFSHFGRTSDELSFKEGEVIEVLEYKSEMWLNGKLHGSTGLVPRNFVSDYLYSENGFSEISNELLLSKFKLFQEQSSSSSSKNDRPKQALVQTHDSQADIRLVMEDFKALTDFELSVYVGDTVHVIKQVNDEWCEVKNNKTQIGFVPATCLQQVKTTSKRDLSTNLSSRANDFFQPEQDHNQSFKSSLEKDEKSLLNSAANSTEVKSHSSPSISAVGSNKSFKDSSITPSTSSSIRRHSHHNRKVSTEKKPISKSQSMRVRRCGNVADPTQCNNETGKNMASNSKSDFKYSNVLQRQVTASYESDRVSVTSRESMHSSTLPSSSCSSTCSDNKIKPTGSSNSEYASKDIRIRKISRSAPPPPSSHITPPLLYNAPILSNSEKLDKSNTTTNQIPISRPSQPNSVVKSSSYIQSDESKLNPAEQKIKVEKIRQEIEEFSRMQKSLEADYNNTFDGKERLEISEERQLVAAKLKRLRSELHNLICDVIGANESPKPKTQPVSDQTTTSSPPPPPVNSPPSAESLAEIKEKRLVKRNHVIRELIKTEEDYLQDVVITINDIMKPLLERDLSLGFKIETIFGNIEDIRECSRNLLNHFKKAETKLPESKETSINVGRILIENAPQMKEIYKIYCRNHDDATALLEKYEDDPEFQVPVQEYLVHIRNKINAFDLGSFLIKPVQRILKYPLLLQELLKLTDIPRPGEPREEYEELLKAVKLIQEVANDINEDKRRKDLVRKYRKGSQEANFAEKIARFSLRSVRKKSARISLRLSHVTGLNQSETVDEKFNSVEQNFKNVEKTIKSFLNNSNALGNQARDLLNIERVVAEHVVVFWASDRSSLVEAYIAAMRRTADHLYRKFHTQTQLRVHTPLSALLQQFKGPQALIQKRFDKLLDYENCLKSSDSKEKVSMAKNVYEALNLQLIDELPALCDLSYKLLDACLALHLRFQIQFQRSLLEVAEPVLRFCRNSSNVRELDKKRIMEDFNASRNQVLVDMRHFTLIPPSFASMTSSVGRGRGAGSTTAGASTFFQQPSPSPSVQQSNQQRDTLLRKYKPEDLYLATSPHSSTDKMSLSCSAGDLLAAIKRQDPLGNINSWFCDNGATQGFLPSIILKLYSSCSNTSSLPTSSPLRNPTPTDSSGVGRIDSRSSAKSSVSPSSATNRDRSSTRETLNTSTTSRSPKREQFRLDYDFAARSTLELAVKEGEIVDLIEESDMEGNREWWLVADSRGKRGYVPANYMTKVHYL